jgi:carboxyl-terminal processing protease
VAAVPARAGGALLLLAGCRGPTAPATHSTADPLADLKPALPFASTVAAARGTTSASPAALAYLGDALDFIQATALYSARIDWPTLHRTALDMTRQAQTPQDTYPAIWEALAALEDHHSGFRDPTQATQAQDVQAIPGQLPYARRLAHAIGYLALPGLDTPSHGASPYATAAHQAIRSVDGADTCGWVVDLRLNTGGYVGQMLAAVGPILGEGIVGSVVDARGQRYAWTYRDGQARLENAAGAPEVVAQATAPAYTLRRPVPPVAVLTGGETRSAGEAITVAFRGPINTIKKLSDGAELILTVAHDADRTGHSYEEAIEPDEVVAGWGMGGDDDPVVQAAVAWLRTQTACR